MTWTDEVFGKGNDRVAEIAGTLAVGPVMALGETKRLIRSSHGDAGNGHPHPHRDGKAWSGPAFAGPRESAPSGGCGAVGSSGMLGRIEEGGLDLRPEVAGLAGERGSEAVAADAVTVADLDGEAGEAEFVVRPVVGAAGGVVEDLAGLAVLLAGE